MENRRACTQMISMTSLRANVDMSINNGKGPYVFRISRQIYHWIGSMCLDEGNAPRFLQLYIYDTTNEALAVMTCTPETIGAIVFSETSVTKTEFDLIVEEHSRIPQRVNKLHPCYMSLQFPLLFVYGEECYKKDMKLVNILGHSAKTEKRMSMNMYYAYQIHDRLNHYNLLPWGGGLFQHYIVTAYCVVEQSQLDYIRQNQSDIRNKYLSGLYDAIMRGDRDGNDLGTRTVLTASFTGGSRYMYMHYLDAFAICRLHGNPSFFITFTCNAKWPEIHEYMEAFPELTTTD
ncbi:DNA helicase [Tanacetum coccineum]